MHWRHKTSEHWIKSKLYFFSSLLFVVFSLFDITLCYSLAMQREKRLKWFSWYLRPPHIYVIEYSVFFSSLYLSFLVLHIFFIFYCRHELVLIRSTSISREEKKPDYGFYKISIICKILVVNQFRWSFL